MQDDIDTVLLRRRAAVPVPGLAERIIAAAQVHISRPRHKVFAEIFMEVVDVVRQTVVIPQPAYTLAALLLLGAVFGAQINLSEEAQRQITPEELASFMLVEDTLNSGEWL